jgi:hypothetical protein
MDQRPRIVAPDDSRSSDRELGREHQRRRGAVEAIKRALANPRWRFRTLDSLARETDLPPSDVLDVIAEHPDIARKSVLTDRRGRDLYVLASRRPSWRERLERIRWMLAR